MKRKALSPRPVITMDIAKDVPASRLAGIGAVCLQWNALERSLDWALLRALDLPWDVWMDLVSRINGVDGKIAIIRKCLAKMPQKHAEAAFLTLAGIEEAKRYRDAVIHATIYDPDASTAPTWQRRGALFDVLISEEALNCLYTRIRLLHHEHGQIVQSFHYHLVAQGQSRQPAGDWSQEQAAGLFLECAARLQDIQKQRQALPPLPAFPDEALDRPPLED